MFIRVRARRVHYQFASRKRSQSANVGGLPGVGLVSASLSQSIIAHWLVCASGIWGCLGVNSFLVGFFWVPLLPKILWGSYSNL